MGIAFYPDDSLFLGPNFCTRKHNQRNRRVIAGRRVTVNPVYNVINGTSLGETIVGTSGKDLIYALGGNDTLRPLAGDDIVYGGDGNDIFYSYSALPSTKLLFGENGNDYFYANGGNDAINGGSGADEVRYTFGNVAVTINLATGTVDEGRDSTVNDTLSLVENATGSDYNDIIFGDDAANRLSGASGNDFIYGGAGSDNMLGNDGNDVIYGEEGNDYLRGYADNDTLYGGGGLDDMLGGLGADKFVFEASSAFSNIDVIRDFSVAEGDMVDVSALLTGYDPLTDLIADFVQITDNGTNSFLAVDVDGGANNFIQIATLSAIIGLTNEEALETSGNLITV